MALPLSLWHRLWAERGTQGFGTTVKKGFRKGMDRLRLITSAEAKESTSGMLC
jgi:hypothetical protein